MWLCGSRFPYVSFTLRSWISLVVVCKKVFNPPPVYESASASFAKLQTSIRARARACMRGRRRSSKGASGRASGAMLDVVIDDDVSHDDERREREKEAKMATKEALKKDEIENGASPSPACKSEGTARKNGITYKWGNRTEELRETADD